MKCKLSDICEYIKGKTDVTTLDRSTYISTENMLPNKAGVTLAAALPSTEQTKKFNTGDTLVSNIRPYFKKIWYANFDGGCSNDVLVFRSKENIDPRFLYYILANNAFFEYSMATSRGTKMPRGDKKAIMEYQVPIFSIEEQQKIAGLLSALDDKIELNNAINKNLRLLQAVRRWRNSGTRRTCSPAVTDFDRCIERPQGLEHSTAGLAMAA